MTTLNRDLQELFPQTFGLRTFHDPADVELDAPLDFHDDAWDLDDLAADERRSASVWSLEDVLDLRPDLSDAQAWEVLQRCQAQHDPECGVSRALVVEVADELFGAGDDEGDPDLLAGYGDPSDAKLEPALARFQAATSHE